jgi:hypothetical protein
MKTQNYATANADFIRKYGFDTLCLLRMADLDPVKVDQLFYPIPEIGGHEKAHKGNKKVNTHIKKIWLISRYVLSDQFRQDYATPIMKNPIDLLNKIMQTKGINEINVGKEGIPISVIADSALQEMFYPKKEAESPEIPSCDLGALLSGYNNSTMGSYRDNPFAQKSDAEEPIKPLIGQIKKKDLKWNLDI